MDEDFHAPCLFNTSTLAPESANKEADVLLKQCPVYESKSNEFKICTIFSGNLPNVFFLTA